MANLPKFRLFTFFALFFLFGIFLANFIKIDFEKSYISLAILLLALLLSSLINFALKNHLIVLTSYLLFCFTLGLGYYSFFDFRHKVTLPYNRDLQIEGRIIKKPDVNYKRQQVVIEILKIQNNNQNETFTPKSLLLVNLPHYPAVRYGDNVFLEAKIEKPGMIEEFDYGRYLKRYLIFGTVNQTTKAEDRGQNLNFGQKIIANLYYVSIRFEEALNSVLPEPHASLASGLILGIKRNIPQEFKDALSVTGLTHIIALSGFNVTILVTIFADSLVMYLGRRKVFIFGLLLIISFVVLTGAASSVVRAGIFSLLLLFGKTLGRRGDFTNIMLLVAVIMIIINPFVLYNDVGFQLSFLAFSGLVFLSPIIEKYIDSKKYLVWMPDLLKTTLTATLGAQIAVFPLIMVIFGRVSLIAPISNVLVLWIVPWSMGVVAVAGLLTIIWYPLGKIASFIAWPALQYIVKMVEWMAKIPGASFTWSTNSWLILPVCYILMIMATFFLYRKYKLSL